MAKLTSQRPRFVYTGKDSLARHSIRMAPLGAVDEESDEAEPIDRRAKEESSRRAGVSSPESALVTPVSGDMRQISVRDESPTPVAKQKRGSSQTGRDLEEDVKPKKRARVAFA
jgi:hypothetical protein